MIFSLSLIFCNFIIRYLSIDLFSSFMSFIEIPEYVDRCLFSSGNFSANINSSNVTSGKFFSPYLLNRYMLDLLTRFFISLNYSSSCSISSALSEYFIISSDYKFFRLILSVNLISSLICNYIFHFQKFLFFSLICFFSNLFGL